MTDSSSPSPQLALAQRLAARFGDLPQVEAVSLTGSFNMGVSDDHSDIDLYIFVQADIPVSDRQAVAAPYIEAEFDNQYWGTEDSWHDQATGIRVEGLYWWVSFIDGEIDRMLHRHQAYVGYSTPFLHSIRNGRILFDRNGWLRRLQAEAEQPYPEELRRAIVAKNHPILRGMSSSYLQQIEIAVQREDVVSVNHRIAALLASYFDVLFALNRVPHPGEKRLIRYAEMLCEKRPPHLRDQITRLVSSAAAPDVVDQINALIDELDALLTAEGFDPARI